MTPKVKAKQLFKKYSKGKDEHGWNLCEFDSCAKQCALIVVDEIIKEFGTYYKIPKETKYVSYWEEVKLEIINYDNTTIQRNRGKK